MLWLLFLAHSCDDIAITANLKSDRLLQLSRYTQGNYATMGSAIAAIAILGRGG